MSNTAAMTVGQAASVAALCSRYRTLTAEVQNHGYVKFVGPLLFGYGSGRPPYLNSLKVRATSKGADNLRKRVRKVVFFNVISPLNHPGLKGPQIIKQVNFH